MDSYQVWLAFLAVEIVDSCSLQLLKDCPGCQDGLLSPLLHYHNHFNLHDTIKKNMPVIVSQMNIQELFNKFLVKFGLFEVPEKEFLNIGQNFIQFSSPDAIYYGKYITKENDQILYTQTLQQPTHEPTKKRKK